VRRQGHFRWKQDEVFLSEVLWGERVGLLQENDRWFTVYFAQHPIALFDSHQLRVAPLLTNSQLGEGEGGGAPFAFPWSPHRTEPESVRYAPGLKCQGSPRLHMVSSKSAGSQRNRQAHTKRCE